MLGMKMMLESFGIKIKPEEVESAWAQAKDALPKLATAFDEMNARITEIQIEQARMREALDKIAGVKRVAA